MAKRALGLRIAHVTSWYIPGLGYEENCLPAEQARAGHHVSLVTSDRLPEALKHHKGAAGLLPNNRNESSHLENEEVEVWRHRCTPEIHGQILMYGLRRRLRDIRPDIVHAHGVFSPISIQCLLLQRGLGYELFIDDHSHELNFYLDRSYKGIYIKMMRDIYRLFGSSVRAFMPVTPASRDILTRYVGISPSRMAPVHLGADARLFKPSPELRKAFRERFNLQPDEILLISSGKFQRNKDIDVLIQAFAEIASKHSDVRLLLAGDGHPTYMAQINQLAVQSEAYDRIIFHPFIPHPSLPMFYNGADIGVWPGAHSITVLEALSTGLPCILPAGDPAYLVETENDACLAFRRGDVHSLAKALEVLITNPATRNRLSRNSRNLIEEQLSWEAVSKRSLEIYQRAIEDDDAT